MYSYHNKTIQTERLLLRPFTEADADAVVEMCSNYNLHKSTLALPHPYTKECAVDWIRTHESNFDSDKAYEFAITRKQDGQLVGCIGLSHHASDQNGEIGYWIGEPYWGMGYATEAAQGAIAFAFQEKQYHRVHARHFMSNPASGRVMQKAGMSYEGTQKEAIYKLGKFEDVAMYGVLNR